MSPSPKSPKVSNKSEEQIHYESLANFLKYGVGIAGTLIVVVASVALFFSFGDRKSMIEENDKLRDYFKTQMTEIRTDAKESRSELESRYISELNRFDESLIGMKADAQERQNSLRDDYDRQISGLALSSKDQVSSIISETRTAASEQTQKEIAAVMKTDRIQKVIEQNAIGELKDKLPTVMATYMRDLPQVLEASTWFDGGSPEGKDKLLELMNSDSEFTRAISKRLYDKIANKFTLYADTLREAEYNRILKEVGIIIPLHRVINNRYPENPTDAANLELLLKVIKNDPFQYMYYQIAPTIRALSFVSGNRFEFLKNEDILTWYKGLKRN